MILSSLLYFALICAGTQSTTADRSRTVPSCSPLACGGKRAVHMHGFLAFCVPRGVKFRRIAGFEGDIHDRMIVRVRGAVSELVMFTANATWGPVKGAPDDWPSPDSKRGEAISMQRWQCSDLDGHDFRFSRDGQNWRMISFAIGFAEYKNVPAKAALQFDRVLGSMCCKRFAKK